MNEPEQITVVLTMRARWTARLIRPRFRSGYHHLVDLVAQLADMVRGAQALADDTPLWLDFEVVAPVTGRRREAVLTVRVSYLRR